MISLRPYKPCDASHIASWIKNETSFYQWSAGKIEGGYPLGAEQLNRHYEKESDNPDFWEMTATNEKGIPVGHFIMRYVGDTRSVIRLGFIVLDDTVRGKGLGKKMVSMALDYAACFLHAEKVTLGVFTNNLSAKRCYEKAGFTTAGTSESHVKEETWECVEMEWIPKKGMDEEGNE